jgi:hypothetical protein
LGCYTVPYGSPTSCPYFYFKIIKLSLNHPNVNESSVSWLTVADEDSGWSVKIN